MTLRLKLMMGVAVSCLPLTVVSPVSAQDEVSSAIDEVVVTATKREASVQDIPASVTAIGADEIALSELTTNRDLQFSVPGLVAGYFNGSSQLAVRGIGANSSTGVDDPAVAQHIDGVYQTRTQSVVLANTDLERVEVLKGPQGTLYGRNSTGGAINYVTKKPTQEFEGNIRLTVGDAGRLGTNILLSGPLTDTLSARASLYTNEQDGYLEIVGGGGSPDNFAEDTTGGRLSLRYTPSDDITVDITASSVENETVVGAQILGVVTPASAFYLAPGNHSLEPNELVSDANPDGNVSQDSFSATIDWTINDNWSLKSITGFSDNAYALEDYDVDYSSSTMVVPNVIALPLTGSTSNSGESITQEFNVTFSGDGIEVVAGIFYLTDEFEQENNFPGFGLVSTFDQDSEATAFFADVSYDVSEQLTLLAGIRSNDEEKEVAQTSTYPGGTGTGKESWDATNPKVGFQYDLGGNAMVYGTWQEGFKAGGFDPAGTASAYNPEEIEAIEVGIKTPVLDGSGILNVAVFDYDYTDLQVQQLEGLVTVISNAGGATVQGMDVEFQYAVNNDLSLDISGSFLDTEVSDLSMNDPFAAAEDPAVDLSGKTLRRAPEFSGTFALNYDMSFSDGSALQLRGEVYHSDDVRFRFFDDEPGAFQEAYSTGNIYANYTPSFAEGMTLRAYVKNVSDEEVLQGVLPFANFGLQLGNYTRGRTAGLEAKYDF